jgi:hypothetical protein
MASRCEPRTILHVSIARFRQLPPIAQAFIVLTALDIVARTIGLMDPPVSGDEIGLIASYFPRDAWIALPAIAVIRRASLQLDAPRLFQGALFIGLVTLLARPVAAFVGGFLPPDPVELHVALNVVESVLTGVAFLVLASGLEALNPKPPRASTAGLANLAAIGVLGAFLAGFVASLLTDIRLDIVYPPPWWSYAGGLFHGACVALLSRGVVRGLDDPSRPELGTRTAGSGALLWAIGLFGEGLVASLYVVTHGSDVSASLTLGFELIQAVGPSLIVAGFALGLADPNRPLASEWADALRADPRAEVD